MSPSILRGFPDPADLDRILLQEMKGLGVDAELAFAAHARHKTGRMARNVKAHVVGQHVDVVVHAKNPISNFDYVAVTRFGHKVEFIEPRKDRYHAYVIDTKRKRLNGNDSRSALRFVINGRVMYRHRVKGFKPDHDWAEDAIPEIERSTERAMRRVKQKIELQR